MTARRAPVAKPDADPRLVAMRKAVQAARRAHGLDDATYRAALARLTKGKTSSTDCTRAELGKVLDFLNGKSTGPTVIEGGAAEAPVRRAAPRADHPSASKARALWLSLHELGVIRDASEASLEAFATRQLGCARMQWMDQGLNYKLIEALKAMAERNGWSQDLAGVKPALRILTLKNRLVLAQLKKLHDAGVLDDADRVPGEVSNLPTIAELTADADRRMRLLGRKIRQHDLVERLN